MNEERIKRYTAEELRHMIANGEDQTNWERVNAITDEELERLIAENPDDEGMDADWSTVTTVLPWQTQRRQDADTSPAEEEAVSERKPIA